MRKPFKLGITLLIAIGIVGGFTAIIYSMPIVILTPTQFELYGLPGIEWTYEVNVPWPYSQMRAIVEISDLVCLDVPAALTGIEIGTSEQQIAFFPFSEPGLYDTGWIDLVGACNVTLWVYGNVYAISYIEGEIVVMARTIINIIVSGEFLVIGDNFPQQFRYCC
ncbi:MAG: hypothetical protein ACFE9O_09590 [Promethearchaeota archaeon]